MIPAVAFILWILWTDQKARAEAERIREGARERNMAEREKYTQGVEERARAAERKLAEVEIEKKAEEWEKRDREFWGRMIAESKSTR